VDERPDPDEPQLCDAMIEALGTEYLCNKLLGHRGLHAHYSPKDFRDVNPR
jgi:hypothetical protein